MHLAHIEIPRHFKLYINNWIADFLINRQQRVKLGEDCFLE